MREWDDISRHMGPGEPAREPEPEQTPAPGAAPVEELDPRYCIRCRKPISREMSDRQSVCDECLAALDALASGPLPGGGHPAGQPPPCPRCGSPDVEREWATDWVSKAVDVVSGLASFGMEVAAGIAAADMRFGSGRGSRLSDPVVESGPVKVLRYHCRTCDDRWKPS
jgi:hypothetical protein